MYQASVRNVKHGLRERTSERSRTRNGALYVGSNNSSSSEARESLRESMQMAIRVPSESGKGFLNGDCGEVAAGGGGGEWTRA